MERFFVDYTSESVYAITTAFYNEKSNSQEISYDAKVKLGAFAKQSDYGKYRSEIAIPSGQPGMLGLDQNSDPAVWDSWQKLGEMDKENAMVGFVQLVEAQISGLSKFVEANKDKLTLKSQCVPNVSETATDADDVDLQADLCAMQLQEREVRELMDEQTEVQFKQYVETEHPGSTIKQQELMQQLKEQQYQQYIQYVYSRLQTHQQHQYDQLASLSRKRARLRRRMQGAATRPPAAPKGSTIVEGFDNLLAKQDAATTSDAVTSLVPTSEQQAEPTTLPATVPTSEAAVAELVDPIEFGDDSVSDDDDDPEDAPNLASIEDIIAQNLPLAPTPPPLLPVSLWTRPDLAAFKEYVQKQKEGICGTMKISSLSSASIKIPTHTRARYVCWEFATDYYDLGFGVEFEWALTPGDEVTVHMSDSEDEDEELVDDGEPVEADAEGGDAESGGSRKRSKYEDLPIDELVPTYRRDCHKEVYCGSHLFSGNGVYHLKFDNTFSLWRSKWVYYRIYYTT